MSYDGKPVTQENPGPGKVKYVPPHRRGQTPSSRGGRPSDSSGHNDRWGYHGERGGSRGQRRGGGRSFSSRRGGEGGGRWQGGGRSAPRKDFRPRLGAEWGEPDEQGIWHPPLGPRNEALEVRLFEEDTMHTGIDFNKYDEIPVDASGNNCPENCPIESFDVVTLCDHLQNCIELSGFTVPTPVQKWALPIATAGRDLMACAQTGSGKTAAFLFPVIHNLLQAGPLRDGQGWGRRTVYPRALVLAPTRELVQQIHKEGKKFTYRCPIKCCVAYGGGGINEQLREMERGCDILVATPGRLVDMIERGRVSMERIMYLVLDEADRMLDMGFEPQIRRIVEDCGMPPVGERITLMFSATFPVEIQQMAGEFLHDYIFLRVGRVGSCTDLITQRVEWVEDHDKRSMLMDLIHSVPGLTLVFVATKRLADGLEHFLCTNDFPATSIHGDRSQQEREWALAAFRSGECPVMVATDVASRGLDIPNVAHVINFDLPNGRAGNQGLATAFINDANRGIAESLVTCMQEAGQDVPDFLISLGSASRYGGRRGGGRRGGSRYGGSDYRREQGGKMGMRQGGRREKWGQPSSSSADRW